MFLNRGGYGGSHAGQLREPPGTFEDAGRSEGEILERDRADVDPVLGGQGLHLDGDAAA